MFALDGDDHIDAIDAHIHVIDLGQTPCQQQRRCMNAPGPHKPINTQFRPPRRIVQKGPSGPFPSNSHQIQLPVPQTPSMSPPPLSPPPPITVHLYAGRTDVHGAINDLWQIAPNETSRLVKCLNTITRFNIYFCKVGRETPDG